MREDEFTDYNNYDKCQLKYFRYTKKENHGAAAPKSEGVINFMGQVFFFSSCARVRSVKGHLGRI